MQVQNFIERYRQGERDFAHIDLSGANLSGMNLREINLIGANLTGACLNWASLHHAKLTGACLRQADLHSAILNSADCQQAIFSRAKLTKVDLRLATLQEADLNWTILQDADLSGADLQGAKLDQANLERAKLNGTQLVAAELMEANLSRASLIGANLAGANLREAKLVGANLREAILVGTNLTEADLGAAYMRGANLSEADLHRAILIGADLSEANLNSADLSRANLTGAYLLKTSLRKAYFLRAILQDVFLLRSDMSETNLRGADLQQADLSGAYLSDTILSEANLSEAFLLESHLIRCHLDEAKMTGCCIHNWHLEDVDLSKVQCCYVFTQFNYTTKKSADRYPVSRDFAPGELNKYCQEGHGSEAEASTVIEVRWQEAPNWEALVFTLTRMEYLCPDLRLVIQSYVLKEGYYLLHLAANHLVNTKILARKILQLYPEIFQLMQVKREAVLDLLKINAVSPEQKLDDWKLESPPPQVSSPPPQPDRRLRMYQEVVNQIQLIIKSQNPNQFVESVQRLLDFLNSQGISTEEIQKSIISQAIVRRSKKDSTFHKQLLQWEKTADEAARFSVMGEAVRLAIALLWKDVQL